MILEDVLERKREVELERLGDVDEVSIRILAGFFGAIWALSSIVALYENGRAGLHAASYLYHADLYA